jgi:glycosyltransferase involved in cell wall biosynthesis
MKILIISTYELLGGAARAANRLHKALLAEGVASQMLVFSKSSDDETIIKPQSKVSKFRPTLDSLPVNFYKDRTKRLFSPAWVPISGIADKINALNPDIVHLHWVCDGMLRIEDLSKIKAPIVWSLHDMWPFTGGCHYDDGCNKYRASCGECPELGSYQENDLSRRIYKRKLKSFNQTKSLTIVGLSRWLADCAKASSLLASRPVVNLPNPIDTTRFAPVDKVTARTILNLPVNKKLVLYGAVSAASDQRKGYKELVAALQLIPTDQDLELVVFGSSRPQKAPDLGFPTHYLGQVYDDVTLQLIYSAADAMVVPSLQENLSNTIMESLACGTPVVGFAIGGNSDMINHLQNGFLAKPFESTSLAEGICWVLDSDNPAVIAGNARKKVLNYFDSHLVAQQYVDLYKQILGKNNF